MLKHLEEYGKFVEITGFAGVAVGNEKDFMATLRDVVPKTVEAQFFDADLVATWQHLYFAVLNALMAFQNKRNISKSIAVEVMLYASAQRQIKKAIAKMGVKQGSSKVAVVIIGSNETLVDAGFVAVKNCLGLDADASVLELSKEKLLRIKSAFSISEAELEVATLKTGTAPVLVDLVVERVALLSTQL